MMRDETARPGRPTTREILDLHGIKGALERTLGTARGQTCWVQLGGSPVLLKLTKRLDMAPYWSPATEVPRAATGDEERSWRAARTGPLALCRYPAILAQVCALADEGGAVPTERLALVEALVAGLLGTTGARLGAAWPGTPAVLRALHLLAGALKARRATDLTRADAVALADPATIDAALAADLLQAEGERLAFSGHLLLECAAARALREAPATGAAPADLLGADWWAWEDWREPLAILSAAWAAGGGDRGERARLAAWLAPHSPELALSILGGDRPDPAIADPALRRALVGGARANAETAHPSGRAAAFRVLGRLAADDRPGIGLRAGGVPDITWRRVPAGTVPLGGDPGAIMAPGQPLPVTFAGDFWMARYPVSVAQFAAFVAARGYDHRDDWTARGWAKRTRERWAAPRFWGEASYHYDNYPVLGVSWYEAHAYARWLDRVHGASLRPAGAPATWQIRLPTETEWEYAARYPDGRGYPWGDTYRPGFANLDETVDGSGPYALDRPSAVGIYASRHGESAADALGIDDLCGHLGEWCQSIWPGVQQFAAQHGDAGSARRVVRGGAWSWGANLARAASREREAPDSRFGSYGFRLVVAARLAARR